MHFHAAYVMIIKIHTTTNYQSICIRHIALFFFEYKILPCISLLEKSLDIMISELKYYFMTSPKKKLKRNYYEDKKNIVLTTNSK